MRFSYLIMIGLGALLWIGRGAMGEVRAERVFRGEREGWELVKISWDGVGEEVGVRDARGGMRVVRRVEGGGEGGGVSWVALPLVGRTQLEGNRWPVEVWVMRKRVVEKGRVALTVGGAASYRVVVAEGAEGDRERGLLGRARLGGEAGSVEIVSLPEGEILGGTALEFAACDAVLLTARVRVGMTEARAAALMNVGVGLISLGDAPPRGSGGVGGLVWDRLPGANGVGTPAGWVTAGKGTGAIAVVEAGLGELRELQGAGGVTVGAGTRWMLWLLAPAGLAVVVLARGLVGAPARPGKVLILMGAGMAILGLVGVAMVRADRAAVVRRMAWRVTRVEGGRQWEEALTVYSPRFARRWETTADAGTVVVPVAAGVREYFRGDAELVLEGSGAARLSVAVGERQVSAVLARTGLAGALMPALPVTEDDRRRFSAVTKIDLAAAWWVDGGYAYPAAQGFPTAATPLSAGELFTNWARDHAEVGAAARAWYALRFEAGRRYLVWVERGELRVVDFGAGS